MPAKPSLLLVSDNLRRFELLIRAALPNTTIVPVKYESWSLDQLAAAINERVRPGHKFASVGFLDHGKPGQFCLLRSIAGGAVKLQDINNDPQLAAFLTGLVGLVHQGGRIDLLACSTAAGPEGAALIAKLESLTPGVNWAASTDMTGSDEKGGDWILETDGVDVRT